MHPADALSEDHRVIERVLNAIEAAAVRLQQGLPVRAKSFVEAADFIAGFADGCHHRKEEEHLFPALEDAGLPRFGGPLGVMLGEHEDGRRYTASLREAGEKLAAGDAAAAAMVVESALGYATLLRQHIQKEDRVLFVMAKRMLSPHAVEDLALQFDRLEREDGNRAAWVAVAERLEHELASPQATHVV